MLCLHECKDHNMTPLLSQIFFRAWPLTSSDSPTPTSVFTLEMSTLFCPLDTKIDIFITWGKMQASTHPSLFMAYYWELLRVVPFSVYFLQFQLYIFHRWMLCPSKDREKLDKLLHTNDVISMCLLSIEFDSKLLFMSACFVWLHSVTHLKYAIGPVLFCF